MPTTMLKLGPNDHGREMSEEEFEGADYLVGYKYEVIDGRLYVSPAAKVPHDIVTEWVHWLLKVYSKAAPNTIGYVSAAGRTFVPNATRVTSPQPDVTAFKHAPSDDRSDWKDLHPVLVVEVLGDDCFDKDMVRNVDLYLRIPTIQEYWVFDIRESHWSPTLLVHRRRGNAWKSQTIAPGGTYTTRLLPGFRLVVDPRT